MLAMLVGCAMAIKPLPSDRDSKSEFDCIDSFVFVGGDAIASVVAFGTGIAAHESKTSSSDQITTTALTIGAVLAVSSAIGAYRVLRCREAEEGWRPSGAVLAPATTPDVVVPLEPAFYCASSPTEHRASMCSRDKADCDRARGVAIAVIEDLAACAPTDAAICFDDPATGQRCAATLEACIAQRDAAMAAPEAPPPGGCTEVRAPLKTTGPY